MNIELVNEVPKQDGYYLVRFGETGGLHLVLLRTNPITNERELLPDTVTSMKKTNPIRVHFNFCWFSKEAITTTLHELVG